MFRLKPRQLAGGAIATTAALLFTACTSTPAVNGETPEFTDNGAATAPAQGGGGGTGAGQTTDFPRNETLFTSGSAWGPPSSWNPVAGGTLATGTMYWCYESLFQFDPINLELVPWLAESGGWVSDDEYTITLRDNLTWQDGAPLTVDDVLFTFEDLAQRDYVGWGIDIWRQLESIERVDDYTLNFHFLEPRPQQWESIIRERMIVPEHIMGTWTQDQLTTGTNENPVCSGPFMFHSFGQDRMVWERNDNWWGIETFDKHMPMRYIIDIVSPSNEVALNMLMQGTLDWSNNFLPGIQQLIARGDVVTYITDSPFMVAGNLAALIINSERPPMDDVNFRRALAFAIDSQRIVDTAYGGIVEKADPTGLLPLFHGYVDEEVVAELGFEFNPARAREILEEAGYQMGADGYFNTPDGERIDLELIVPAGWTDWMDAARLISESAAESGIRISINFPDSGFVDHARMSGNFDLTINNDVAVSSTPWTLYRWLFNYPISEIQFGGNMGRFDWSQEAWPLTEELAATRNDDPRFREIISELQRIQLEEMPIIPMWYNGFWWQGTEGTWSCWANSEGPVRGYPVTVNNWLGFGSIEVLANLCPVG